MAENTKQNEELIKTQKQSHGLQREAYVKVVTRLELPTTSHIIILMLFLFVLILC
jgi:hypothetical protein